MRARAVSSAGDCDGGTKGWYAGASVEVGFWAASAMSFPGLRG